MEDIFSISRFWKQLKSDLLKSWRNMNFSFCLMSCSGAITYLFILGLRWMADWNELSLIGNTRGFIFGVMMTTLCIVTPTRCFGSVTQLREGRFYLQLPSSVLEKSLSMILICTIIVPLSATGIYLAWDALICRFDPSCGSPLPELMEEQLWGIASVPPYSLAFLLGALIFKKNKMAKTIGCILLFYVFCLFFAGSLLESINFNQLGTTSFTADLSWISGAITIVLMGLIFWRVRTIQH